MASAPRSDSTSTNYEHGPLRGRRVKRARDRSGSISRGPNGRLLAKHDCSAWGTALTDQLAIARASAETAQRLFEASSRAAGRGDIAGADLDTRRQALLDASSKARVAEHDLVAARSDLNKQLGLPPEVTSCA